jgi:hypothetical protein
MCVQLMCADLLCTGYTHPDGERQHDGVGELGGRYGDLSLMMVVDCDDGQPTVRIGL